MVGLSFDRSVCVLKESSLTDKIRDFIAEHLSLDFKDINIDAHLNDDLGLDLLDVVELTILLEERFACGNIVNETDQIQFVRDLISHIEDSNLETESRA